MLTYVHVDQIYFGLASGRVLNKELYTHRIQLHGSTVVFLAPNIFLYKGVVWICFTCEVTVIYSDKWEEILMKQICK